MALGSDSLTCSWTVTGRLIANQAWRKHQRALQSGASAALRAAAADGPATAAAAAARRRNMLLAAGLLVPAAGGALYLSSERHAEPGAATALPSPSEETLVNWSGTHEVAVKRLYYPGSLAELESLVAAAHESGASKCGADMQQEGAGFMPGLEHWWQHQRQPLPLQQASRVACS